MRSISFAEYDVLVQETHRMAGARVEELVFSRDRLFLSLYLKGERQWWVLDVGSPIPGFYISSEEPRVKAEVKPLLLFLRSRLKGGHFVSCKRLKEFGRVLCFEFNGSEGVPFFLEAHLFPQNKNLLAVQGKSKLSLHKPRELKAVEPGLAPHGELRSLPQMYREWKDDQVAAVKNPTKKSPEAQRLKQMQKKQKAREALEQQLQDLEDSLWAKVGEWLKSQSVWPPPVPEEWKSYVDLEKSLAENLEQSFFKAKQSDKKKQGTQERIDILTDEIAKLEKGEELKTSKEARGPSLLQEAKGRTKVLSDKVVAYVGKSAADNLKLLRKAKAWYIWVHAKDFPGSHGIIALPKNTSLSETHLREVALWVLKESLTPKQWEQYQGVKCDFLYCECRFVSPIKGDKMGRVRYQNEKVITLAP